MNYRYIGILLKIAECVGALMKLEIPIRQKTVRLVPPVAIFIYLDLHMYTFIHVDQI